ncbi:MAG: ABC transporter ATP-binding protein [Bacillota bacterium]
MGKLKTITYHDQKSETFPYNLPFFNGKPIKLSNTVTIISGSNGSGKSTLLELLAEKLGLYRITEQSDTTKTLRESILPATRHVDATYNLQKPKGFLFSAEDFTKYIQFLEHEKALAKQELETIDKTYKNKSTYAKMMAKSPHNKTLGEIDSLYQNPLLTASHGEAYLDFFSSRLRPNTLYLLDEPETPLSIQNQLTLLVLIHNAVKQGAQLIIATHSPIISAYPNATLYTLSPTAIDETNFDTIESVKLLKDFLENKEAYLNHLFKGDDV